MANEILATAILGFTKGSFSEEFRKVAKQFTMSGTEYIRSVLVLADTSATAIPLGSIDVSGGALPGYALFYNDDSTYSVTLRNGSGGASLVKIKPKEFALFRLATSTPYAVAAGAGVKLEYLILED